MRIIDYHRRPGRTYLLESGGSRRYLDLSKMRWNAMATRESSLHRAREEHLRHQMLEDDARYIHPQKDVAFEVAVYAEVRYIDLSRFQTRNAASTKTKKPSKHPLPYRALLQEAVLYASEEFEMVQEGYSEPSEETQVALLYHLTEDDWPRRWAVSLVRHSIRSNCIYAAVAIFHFLAAYRLYEIAELSEECFGPYPWSVCENLVNLIKGGKRHKGRFLDLQVETFKYLDPDTKRPRLEKSFKSWKATDHESSIIDETLKYFAPRDIPLCSLDSVPALFHSNGVQEEPRRTRWLIEDGLEVFKILYAYHLDQGGLIQLTEPEMYIPVRGNGAPPERGDSSLDALESSRQEAPDDQTDQMSDTPQRRNIVDRAFSHNQLRRRLYQPGPLRVRVNGMDRKLPDAGGVLQIRLPEYAYRLEVWGTDAEGELHLATFPLPGFDEIADSLQLVASVENGLVFVLDLAPQYSTSGRISRIRASIRVEHGEPEERVAVTGNHFHDGEPLGWPEVNAYASAVTLRSPSFLHGFFDAISEEVNRLQPFYDDAHKIIEIIEPVGGRSFLGELPYLADIFCNRYADLCAEAPNSILKAGLAWGINELLERGKQAELGIAIAHRLAQRSDDVAIRRVLQTLCSLHGNLAAELEKGGYKLPPVDEDLEHVERLVASATQHFSSWRPQLPLPTEMDEIMRYWYRDRSDTGMGIVALGAIKRVLHSGAVDADGDYQRVRALCLPILAKIDEDANIDIMLGIEPLEAVRDRAPAVCARVMAEFLLEAKKIGVAQGIVICIVEGFEEGGEKGSPARQRLAHVDGQWVAVDAYPHHDKNELDVFFELFAECLNARPAFGDLGVWTNQRLDMHPVCRPEEAVVPYALGA